MKKLLAWLGIAFLPACCTHAYHYITIATPPPLTHAEMIAQLEYETVALVHYADSEGNVIEPINAGRGAKLHSYCTGVWVSANVILTAEHCIDDIGKPADAKPPLDATAILKQMIDQINGVTTAPPPQLTEWTPVGQPVIYSTRGDIADSQQTYHDSACIAVDMYNDLALIRVKDPGDHPIAHLMSTTPSPGDEVHIIGMPSGMWWTYTHGYVSGHLSEYTNNEGKPHDYVQVSAAVFFGNSGGPAFNAAGDLIGTADSFKRNVPDISLFTCHDTIRGFLEHNKIIGPLSAR